MKTIYKYAINVSDDNVVMLPQGHQTLCVQVQGYLPTLWVLVDTAKKSVPVKFKIVGTGWDIGEAHPSTHIEKYRASAGDFFHIGTVQISGFVWHVFEEEVEYE